MTQTKLSVLLKRFLRRDAIDKSLPMLRLQSTRYKIYAFTNKFQGAHFKKKNFKSFTGYKASQHNSSDTNMHVEREGQTRKVITVAEL